MSGENLTEIEFKLPNGLHDAEINSINLNYVERTIVFDLMVWVGDLDSSDRAQREAYVHGILTISGFDFCVIEPPDSRYPYMKRDGIRIDSGAGKPPHISVAEDPPADMFEHWFFTPDWNSFIYFRAQAAQLEIIGDKILR